MFLSYVATLPARGIATAPGEEKWRKRWNGKAGCEGANHNRLSLVSTHCSRVFSHSEAICLFPACCPLLSSVIRTSFFPGFQIFFPPPVSFGVSLFICSAGRRTVRGPAIRGKTYTGMKITDSRQGNWRPCGLLWKCYSDKPVSFTVEWSTWQLHCTFN